ncbi:MAG: Maltose O-acetyltransferase [Pseudomonadota bacterium]|jgi:acetyltransferase-like isoleucine patch superfamily enzyme
MVSDSVADLALALRRVKEQRDEELRATYDRSLPFADAQFDRWERARSLGFGEKTSIYDSSAVFGTVHVGTNTWIGPFTILDGSGGGLTIGDYCSISAGVHIYTHDTVLWAVSGGVQNARKGAVVIGSNTYIGAQSVIVAGVTIGSRCVIAANSLVNRDVPDGTIVGGTPARVLGRVEGEGADARLVFDRKDQNK